MHRTVKDSIAQIHLPVVSNIDGCACKNYTEHYENVPMQYTEIFKVVKNENFQLKSFAIFLIFAQNIHAGTR